MSNDNPNGGTPPEPNGGNGNPADQGGQQSPNPAHDKTGDGDGQGGNPSNPDDPVPYKRFAFEVAQRKEMEKKYNAEIEKQKEAHQKQLEEQGKFKELFEAQTPKVQRAEKLEAVVQKSVDQLMEKIPEDKQKLIPQSLSVEDKLDYIHTNFEYLTQSANKNINPGTNPGSQESSTKTFTQEQLKDSKFYNEHREEIRQAQKEGRIK